MDELVFGGPSKVVSMDSRRTVVRSWRAAFLLVNNVRLANRPNSSHNRIILSQDSCTEHRCPRPATCRASCRTGSRALVYVKFSEQSLIMNHRRCDRVKMEEALILVTLHSKYPTGLTDTLKKIPGVVEAKFIYGPYDLYAIVKSENKEKLRNTVLQIRESNGV